MFLETSGKDEQSCVTIPVCRLIWLARGRQELIPCVLNAIDGLGLRKNQGSCSEGRLVGVSRGRHIFVSHVPVVVDRLGLSKDKGRVSEHTLIRFPRGSQMLVSLLHELYKLVNSY